MTGGMLRSVGNFVFRVVGTQGSAKPPAAQPPAVQPVAEQQAAVALTNAQPATAPPAEGQRGNADQLATTTTEPLGTAPAPVAEPALQTAATVATVEGSLSSGGQHVNESPAMAGPSSKPDIEMVDVEAPDNPPATASSAAEPLALPAGGTESQHHTPACPASSATQDATAAAPSAANPEAVAITTMHTAGTAADTVTAPRDAVDAAADAGPEGQAGQSSEAAAPPPEEEEEDLESRVRGLLPYIPTGCPAAVSVTWLLQEALRVAVPPEDTGGAAAAEAVLQNFQRGLDQRVAAAQRLLQGDAEQVQRFEQLPPMLRGMCAGERVAAELRRQLAALQQEEAAWMDLQRKYGLEAEARGDEGRSADGAEAAAGGDAEARNMCELPAAWQQAALQQQNEEEEEEQEVKGVELESLMEAKQRADLELEVQMEALESFLAKAECLVTHTQQTCLELQASHHLEHFANARLDSTEVIVKMWSQNVFNAGADFVPPTQPTQG